jgi:hypothetical protein
MVNKRKTTSFNTEYIIKNLLINTSKLRKKKKNEYDDVDFFHFDKNIWNYELIKEINNKIAVEINNNNIKNIVFNFNGDFNDTDGYNDTLLHFTLKNNLIYISNYLISNYNLIDLNILDEYNNNYIHCLLKNIFNKKIESFIISKFHFYSNINYFLGNILQKYKNNNDDIYINKTNNCGLTPLSFIYHEYNNCINKDLAFTLTNYLIAHGAKYDINCCIFNDDGIGLIQYLVKDEFIIKKYINNYGGILHTVCKLNNINMFNILLNNIKTNIFLLNQLNYNKKTPLEVAIDNNNLNFITLLIKNKIDLSNIIKRVLNSIETNILINDGRIYGLTPLNNNIIEYSYLTLSLLIYIFIDNKYKLDSVLSSKILHRWIFRLKIYKPEISSILYENINKIVDILLSIKDINFNYTISNCDVKTLCSLKPDHLQKYSNDDNFGNSKLPIDFYIKMIYYTIDYKDIFLKLIKHKNMILKNDSIIKIQHNRKINDITSNKINTCSILKFLIIKSLKNIKYIELIKLIIINDNSLTIHKKYNDKHLPTTLHFLLALINIEKENKNMINQKILNIILNIVMKTKTIKTEYKKKILRITSFQNYMRVLRKKLDKYEKCNCKNKTSCILCNKIYKYTNHNKECDISSCNICLLYENINKIKKHTIECKNKEECYICYTNNFPELVYYIDEKLI